MFLLINDDYGQEVTAIYYDETTMDFKSVLDDAKTKYPKNAYTTSTTSKTTKAPEQPVKELTDEEKKAAALSALDAHYQADKEELASQYLDAAMSGDTDTLASIKEEVAELNSKYDADYTSLNGSTKEG